MSKIIIIKIIEDKKLREYSSCLMNSMICLYIYSLMFIKTNNIRNIYISILFIEKNSIYFLFKICENSIKIQNETAPLIYLAYFFIDEYF